MKIDQQHLVQMNVGDAGLIKELGKKPVFEFCITI